MMDTMKAFLESSTIHGLSYMSTNRKYARLFWTFVVISGFSAAIILIYQSFQAWSSSPITTTIETLSITDITFPKVTVCPPKNTYTNLNYDLKMISNLTLDEDYRKELSYLALEVINDITFEDLMKNMSLFNEVNRYYNWYQGHTKVGLPYYDDGNGWDKNPPHMEIKFHSYATSGCIFTEDFGEEFDPEHVLGTIFIENKIFVPESENRSDFIRQNMSLYFQVEKNSIENINSGYETFDFRAVMGLSVPIKVDERYFTRNFTPAQSVKKSSLSSLSAAPYSLSGLKRIIPQDEINNMKIEKMPGFKIQWSYAAINPLENSRSASIFNQW